MRARASRAFSPPEKLATFCVTWSPRMSKPPRKSRNTCSRSRGRELLDVPERRLVEAQLVDLVLREIADAQALRAMQLPDMSARLPTIDLRSVDFPRRWARASRWRPRQDAPFHAGEIALSP
jgi:hypothetical protein